MGAVRKRSGDAPRQYSALMAAARPSPPELVRNPALLIGNLRKEAGETRCAFAGFDFPIGVPAFYAERAGISSFRTLLPNLGSGEWKDFYSVCDKPGQISVHRPFYLNGAYKGRRKEDLFRAHGVSSVKALLRRCERGGNGQEQACYLTRTWKLGFLSYARTKPKYLRPSSVYHRRWTTRRASSG